ncbi:hypothetical protein Tco_1415099 [Tanacetum coccineum]
MQDIKQELGVSVSDAKKYKELHQHSGTNSLHLAYANGNENAKSHPFNTAGQRVSSACEIASSINDKRRREFIAMKWGFLEAFFPEACSFMLCDLDFEPLSLSLSSLPSCDLLFLTNMLILLHYLESFKSELAEVFVFQS